MTTATATHTETEIQTTVHTRAPSLAALVDVMLRVRTHPDDRRARIQRGLLARSGADRCPSCQSRLLVEGYALTRTSFLERESLKCGDCPMVYVVRESALT